MSDIPFTYEKLRAITAALPPPHSSTERDIKWIFPDRLAISRGHKGHIEIFIRGPKLEPTLPAVRDNVDHQTWFDSKNQPFDANRLLLPSADYFEQAAAFISIELIRANVANDPTTAFSTTEPIIEVWLQKLQLSNQSILGLAGELLLLDALLSQAPQDRQPELVGAWLGHTHSNRDFELPPIGIEVKTTTTGVSRHRINNSAQLELGKSSGGTPETHLFLASIGLHPTDDPVSGWTLPVLVDRVVLQLDPLPPDRRKAITRELLIKIEQYGGENRIGYNHTSMRDDPRYTRPFVIQFARLYDMRDTAIRTLRLPDIHEFDNVDPQSVSYQLRLPEKVRGDLNPTNTLPAIAQEILRLASWS